MAGATLERLDDLLLRQATEGLDPVEESELDRLLALHEAASTRGYEQAAAAVCLAVYGSRTLPRLVRERLERSAAAFAAAGARSDD